MPARWRDEFGTLGEDGLLRAGRENAAAGPEQSQDELVEVLGLNGNRAALKAESDKEFDRICEGRSVMSMDEFCTAAIDIWRLDWRCARACFLAADADGSKRLNATEYLLLREAFHHYPTVAGAAATHPSIALLQMRSLQRLYDANEDGVLSLEEVRAWVRDMCAGDSHVDRMIDLSIPSIFKPGAPGQAVEETLHSLATIGPECIATLQQLGLEANDVLKSFVRGQRKASFGVVLDESAATTQVGTSAGTRASRHSDVALNELIDGGAVNAGLVLDERLRAWGDWRGPFAAVRETELFEVASTVLERSISLIGQVLAEPDSRDENWETGGVLHKLFDGDDDRASIARKITVLATGCERVCKTQPFVVHVPAPAKIFGDIHGHFRDLLLLFGEFGIPSHRRGDIETTAYVFNGDWVDRGAHQLEVVCLLFALKVFYPSRIFLVRGNHEFRLTSEKMDDAKTGYGSFRQAVQQRLGAEWQGVYDAIFAAFEWLPLAAVISQKVLAER